MVVQLHPVAMRVAELLEPHVERQGFELVSVEYRKGTRSSLLRLLVDKPGGGIALSDLERLSPVLGDLLDVYDPDRGALHAGGRVAGSQPAADASSSISRRLSGQRVRIKTHRAMDGQKSFVGAARVGESGGS